MQLVETGHAGLKAMLDRVRLDPRSVLLLTLDSCRFDAFEAARAPNLKAIGPLHRAMAPANFTFASHCAIFVGFTPGVPEASEPFLNPKFAKLFKLEQAGFPGYSEAFASLRGRNIIEGFRRLGMATLGSGAVGWFDPASVTGKILSESFDEFFYPGDSHSLPDQIGWATAWITARAPQPVFLFLNIGETHAPYYYRGAPWDPADNPCVPFGKRNSQSECRRRQIACIEYVDQRIGRLLDLFSEATTVACADHGDCWGEDGLWEHGISHTKVLEVPLLYRLGVSPSAPALRGVQPLAAFVA